MSKKQRRQKGKGGSNSAANRAPKLPVSNAIKASILSWGEEAAEAYGLDLFGVDVTSHWLIRVFVERKNASAPGEGVTVDQCVAVSRYIEGLLDASSEVPEKYTLEVSSPGIEAPITQARQLPLVVGRKVRVVTRDAIDGQNVFEGELLEFQDDVLRIDTGAESPASIPWGEIAKAKLTYDF